MRDEDLTMLARSPECGEALNFIKATGFDPFSVSFFFRAGGGFKMERESNKKEQVMDAWKNE